MIKPEQIPDEVMESDYITQHDWHKPLRATPTGTNALPGTGHYYRNEQIARLTARVRELEGLAFSYLQAAKHVGGCGDGNCVVLRPTGMHTNGGCRCTHDMDRARERGVARLLGMAQHIARAALSGDKQ
jgi:hypothetical protein